MFKMFKHKKDQNKRMTEEEFVKLILNEYGDKYCLIIERQPNCLHVFVGDRKTGEGCDRPESEDEE